MSKYATKIIYTQAQNFKIGPMVFRYWRRYG